MTPPPDPPAVREALERYRREAYATGHFGDPEYRNVGYLTSEGGWSDRAILANAYAAEHPEPPDPGPTAGERYVCKDSIRWYVYEWIKDGRGLVGLLVGSAQSEADALLLAHGRQTIERLTAALERMVHAVGTAGMLEAQTSARAALAAARGD